jgi:hypothetical protein
MSKTKRKPYDSDIVSMPIEGSFASINEPIAYMRMGAALRADELGVDRNLAMDFAEAGYRTAMKNMTAKQNP